MVLRPGVEIVQEIRAPSTNLPEPRLPAVIVAPAYEVVELRDESGNLNGGALFKDSSGVSYKNFQPLVISETEFPGGHSYKGTTNVKAGQVKVLPEEVRVFVALKGGSGLRELAEYNLTEKRSVYKAFLTAHHVATQPFLLSGKDLSATNLAISGMSLVVAVDKSGTGAPLYLPDDVQATTIIFKDGSASGGALTLQDIVDQINAALPGVAYAVDGKYLALVSPKTGIQARIVVFDIGASEALGFHKVGQGPAYALGSGYRARDDRDGDTQSPYLEFFQGEARILTSGAKGGFIVGSDLTQSSSYQAGYPLPAVDFASDLALKEGDEIWADGQRLGLLKEVRPDQLLLSDGPPAATQGELLEKEVGLPSSTSPFAPQYIYYYARNVDIASAGTSAQLDGDSLFTASAPAQVTASSTPASPDFGSGKTLIYTATVDGIKQPERVLTVAGSGGSVADVVQALNTGTSANGKYTASPSLGDWGELEAVDSAGKILLRTKKKGYSQKIDIGNGTANSVLDSGSTPNIASGLTYDGLDPYVSGWSKGDGGAYLEGAKRAGGDVTNIASYTPKITAITGNAKIVVDLSVSGDWSGGSNFTDSNLQIADNLARALNGELNSATSGSVTVTAIDGAALSPAPSLRDRQSLVSWEFLGPRNYVYVAGTSLTGSFSPGVEVTQATTGAKGIVISFTSGTPNVMEIEVTSGKFDGNNSISAGTNVLSGISYKPRLALRCASPGSSNYVKLENATSAGFTSPTTVRGQKVGPGTVLGLHLDGNPKEITVEARSIYVRNESRALKQVIFLSQIVEDLNKAAQQTIAAAVEGASTAKLRLSSNKKGLPSSILIYPEGNAGYVEIFGGTQISDAELGLSWDKATAESDAFAGKGAYKQGSGRPIPEFYLTESPLTLHIESQLLRDVVTGEPLRDAEGELYIAYRGRRLDLSPAALEDLPSVSSLKEIEKNYGPTTEKNPLGLALRVANAAVDGLPLYFVSPAGSGEVEWAEVLDFLKSKRAYALSPVTDDDRILRLFADHVISLSKPPSRNEAVVYLAHSYPDRKEPLLIESGEDAQTQGGWTIVLDKAVTTAITGAGVKDLSNITVADGVYLEIFGQEKRFSVASAQASGGGTVLTLRGSFAAGENDDGFYSTQPLPFLATANWRLFKRGEPLSNTQELAEALAALGRRYKHRRVRSLIAKSIIFQKTELPSFYLPPVFCAMASGLPPQQGFTRFPIPGLEGVKGTNDTFSEEQLDLIASGGNNVIVLSGGTPVSRHQLTTDVSSIETQEDSITRILDFVSVFLREAFQPRIGVANITPEFKDEASALAQSVLAACVQAGIIEDGEVNKVEVDPDNPTALLVDVILDVPFPVNLIRVTVAI